MVMDFMFRQIGVGNENSEDKQLRSRVWVCLSKWLFKEISKKRTNTIASFHNTVKSKCIKIGYNDL